MTVSVAPPFFYYLPNTAGIPAAGFKLFTYQAGTSTKQATWVDSTQTTQNSNPILLDANGFVAAASGEGLFCDPTLTYKFVLALPTDTDPPTSPIRTLDNVQSPITLASLTAGLIGTIIYPQTAAEAAASVTPTNYVYSASSGIDVRRYMSASQLSDFNAGTLLVDQATALQTAISVAKATTNWGSLVIPGKLYINTTVNIDRLVQTMNSEFIIQGVGPQAGFYTNGNVTIFDSTLSAPSSPQSEFVTFKDIRFESSSQSNTSYVMSQKFLRIKFLHCTFYQIRCVTASYYIQTWKFEACLIKAYASNFVYAPGSYDVGFLDCEVGNYGATAGILIKVDNADSSSRGCNGLRIIGCLIEGITGTAWLTGTSGFVMTGNHIESNGATDVNLFAGSLTNNSVYLASNYVFCPNGPWINHGTTTNAVSVSNTVTKGGSGTSGAGELHSGAVHVTNLASFNDFADGGISDNPFTYSFGALNIQGPTSGASPTTATRIINRRVSLTYSASINVDASQGNSFDITANSGAAFTINAPTNSVDGQYIEFNIANTSGGALGALTFAAGYKIGAAWSQPANGFNRCIVFQYNGSNWYERSRSAADVTN